MNGFGAIVYDRIAKYDRRQPPSPRNERIYQAVMVDCRRQADVAAEEKISQRRVSQIVEKVALWRRSRADGPEVGRADPRKDRRTADQLDRERLEGLYVRSVRAFDDAEAGRKVTTVRKREGASGEATDTTTRDLVPSVQHLKVAQRALEMIWKLNDRPQPHSEYPRMTAVEKAIDELVHLRLDIEEPGLQTRSRNPRDLVCRLVAMLISSNPAELEKIYLWAEERAAPADPPKEAATGTAPTVAEGTVGVEVTATVVAANDAVEPTCGAAVEPKSAASEDEVATEKSFAEEAAGCATGILPVLAEKVGGDGSGDDPTTVSGPKDVGERSLISGQRLSKKPDINMRSQHQPTLKAQHGQNARGTRPPRDNEIVECPQCHKRLSPPRDDAPGTGSAPKFHVTVTTYELCDYCRNLPPPTGPNYHEEVSSCLTSYLKADPEWG